MNTRFRDGAFTGETRSPYDPGGEFDFRAMTERDLSAVLAIEHGCYDFPWSEGIFRDCLRAGYYCCLLTCEEEILGYSILAVAAGEAHVLNLCIKHELQGHGLGASLLDHLFERARAAQARTMLLEVRVTNEAAFALYTRMGFSEIGIRRNYYPGKFMREDAIVLSKQI